MKIISITTLIIFNSLLLSAQIISNKDSTVSNSVIKFDSLIHKHNLELIASKPFYFNHVRQIKSRLKIDLLKKALECRNFHIMGNDYRARGFNSTKIIVYTDNKEPVIQFNKIRNKVINCNSKNNRINLLLSIKGLFIFVYKNMLVLTHFKQQGFEKIIRKEGLKNIKYIEDKAKR